MGTRDLCRACDPVRLDSGGNAMTVELRLIPGGLVDDLDQPRMWEPNEHWQEQAACRGINPELFFPGRGDDSRAAKAVCLTSNDGGPCPVIDECRAHHFDERFGIWFGTSERERREMRRQARKDRGLAVVSPKPVERLSTEELRLRRKNAAGDALLELLTESLRRLEARDA